MTLHYRAAVLHRPHSPLQIETIAAAPLASADVLVRVRAAGLCHTDLEVIDGSLRYPMPIVLGHEAAGVIEEVGPAVRRLKKGDHVILSWNPHCGHCYYCDRGLPILCEDYLGKGAQAVQFDGTSKARRASGEELKHLMFIGAFGEYCIVHQCRTRKLRFFGHFHAFRSHSFHVRSRLSVGHSWDIPGMFRRPITLAVSRCRPSLVCA